MNKKTYLGNQKGGWKGVLIGCAVVIVIIIAVVVGAAYWGVKKVKEFANIEPAKVEQIAYDMVDYTMPVESEGVWGMDMEMLGIKVAIVKNTGHPMTHLLILGTLPAEAGEKDLKKVLNEKVSYDEGDLTVEAVTVCGVETEAHIGTGNFDIKDNKVEMSFVQTFIVLEDKTLFIMAGCAGEDKEAKARALFDSVSCK